MTAPRHVTVGNISIGNDRPLALIAGPCALESRAHAREMCHALTELTGKLGIGLIYKTSFDKANRTSADTPRGMSDPGKYRSKEEVAQMRQKRDPIENFANYLREGGHADEAALKAIDREIKDIVTEATEFAQSSPEPDPAELYTDVLIDA